MRRRSAPLLAFAFCLLLQSSASFHSEICWGWGRPPSRRPLPTWPATRPRRRATATVIVAHESLAALTARFVGDVLGGSLYASSTRPKRQPGPGSVPGVRGQSSIF
jgi:hypothetical protein